MADLVPLVAGRDTVVHLAFAVDTEWRRRCGLAAEPAQGEVLAAQLDYWRRALAGPPPALDLPTDLPAVPCQSLLAGAHTRVLSRPSRARSKN